MKIAIIGAGPAGLTAGYELSKKDKDVIIHIYEASNEVGGMCKTLQLWGSKVDIGPHRFFSYDKKVNSLWLEIVGKDYKMVNRKTRIFFRNSFFEYPIRPIDALSKIGVVDAIASLFSFFIAKIKANKVGDNFESWVVNKFGKKLFELFFKTYSEKLWGINCKELDADFAAQRIKKLSLWEVVISALSVSKGKNRHKTLVDQFAYPIEGTGMVYKRMAEKILSQNKESRLFFNTPVKSCKVENGKVRSVELYNGVEEVYDIVISSMPLTKLVENSSNVPQKVIQNSKQLTFRNTVLVYLKIDAVDLFTDNWLYIHAPELKLGRITNFRNWVPEMYGDTKHTILALEYWCNFDDDFWQWDNERYISLAKEEVVKTGLVKKNQLSDAYIHKIPNCYPVYKLGYKEQLEPIISYFKTIKNLYPIGRYGAFKYNNQDHSILMGILACENIRGEANHNLWDINTDYDVYQESTIIDATGLVGM